MLTNAMMSNEKIQSDKQPERQATDYGALIPGACVLLLAGGMLVATYLSTPQIVMNAAAANVLSSLCFLSRNYDVLGKVTGCAAGLFFTSVYVQENPEVVTPAKTQKPA